MQTRVGNTRHEVASVVSAAAIALVGAWLLVLAAGTVAIFAVVIVAGLCAPLRWRRTPRRRAALGGATTSAAAAWGAGHPGAG